MWIEKLNAPLAAVVLSLCCAFDNIKTRSSCSIHVITFILFFKTNSKQRRVLTKNFSIRFQCAVHFLLFAIEICIMIPLYDREKKKPFDVRERERESELFVSRSSSTNVNSVNKVAMFSFEHFTCILCHGKQWAEDKTSSHTKDFWSFDLQMMRSLPFDAISFTFTKRPPNTQLCKSHEMKTNASCMWFDLLGKHQRAEKILRNREACAPNLCQTEFIACLLILSRKLPEIFFGFSQFESVNFCLHMLNNSRYVNCEKTVDFELCADNGAKNF